MKSVTALWIRGWKSPESNDTREGCRDQGADPKERKTTWKADATAHLASSVEKPATVPSRLCGPSRRGLQGLRVDGAGGSGQRAAGSGLPEAGVGVQEASRKWCPWSRLVPDHRRT